MAHLKNCLFYKNFLLDKTSIATNFTLDKIPCFPQNFSSWQNFSFKQYSPLTKHLYPQNFPPWQKLVCHKVSPLDKTTLSIKYSAKIFFLNHQQKPCMCQNILSESSAKTFHVPKYSFWTISINLSCAKIFSLNLQHKPFMRQNILSESCTSQRQLGQKKTTLSRWCAVT